MMYEKMSEHFNRSEFACRGDGCCAGSAPVCYGLISALEALRSASGAPINVNSGFRCYKHNQEVGSQVTSQHPRGTAADIRFDGRDHDTFYNLAQNFFETVIIYEWGLHVDVRQKGG